MRKQLFLTLVIFSSLISFSYSQESPIKENVDKFFNSDVFQNFINDTNKITGEDNYCNRGTYSSFGNLKKWRDKTITIALNTPWKLVNALNAAESSDQLYNIEHRYHISKENNDIVFLNSGYQYYWSLEGVYNRRSFKSIEKNYKIVLSQLSHYYMDQFGVDKVKADFWSKFYLHALRTQSSGKININFFNKQLNRVKSREADIEDILDIVASRYSIKRLKINKYNSLMYPKIVYDRALNIAVGANAPIEVIHELLTSEANINGEGEPVIFNSIDNPKLLKLLIKNGAEIDRRNGFGKTALMMAAHMNNDEAVMLLSEAGADPNAKTWEKSPLIEDEYGNMRPDCRYSQVKIKERTPLMYAAENSSLNIFKILVEAGADIHAMDTRRRTVKALLLKNTVMNESEFVIANALLNFNRPN